MTQSQFDFFGAGPVLPDGFRYQPAVISPDDEQGVLQRVRELPFGEFTFQGYVGKRRVVSYGWRYDFEAQRLHTADDIPPFLLALREVAAAAVGVSPAQLRQVLVTEYEAGAGIGWHRDKAVFGDVVGISLRSSCLLRLRRRAGAGWERASVTAAPRSVYLLHGPARTEWEHSIPPVDALRYSVTFRGLRGDR